MIRAASFFKRTLVSFVKRAFRSIGYEIVSDSSAYMTMDGGLSRIKSRNIPIQSVIDVGASNGRWSELCMKYFPDCHYHLFEAQAEYGKALESLRKQFSRLDFSLSVAGNTKGTIYFDDHIVGGGIASPVRINENYKPMECSTIDYEAEKRGMPGPFLIKLDTHGFEIPILEGATTTLAKTNIVVIECYNFQLNANSKRFHEMVTYMETKGFGCVDIVDLSLREKDKFLWQMDIFFARLEMKEFADNSYN